MAKLGKAKVEETRGKEAKIEEILGTITSEMERIYMRRDVMREMEAALDALGVSDISDRD